MNVAVVSAPPRGSLLGTVAFLCGWPGLSRRPCSGSMRRPHSPVLGRYGCEIANGGPLREDLILLAVLFGAVAIVGAILSSMGGRAKASTMASVCLGAFALTYPVMAWLDLVSAPLRSRCSLARSYLSPFGGRSFGGADAWRGTRTNGTHPDDGWQSVRPWRAQPSERLGRPRRRSARTRSRSARRLRSTGWLTDRDVDRARDARSSHFGPRWFLPG